MVEHLSEEQGVGGSRPPLSTNFILNKIMNKVSLILIVLLIGILIVFGLVENNLNLGGELEETNKEVVDEKPIKSIGDLLPTPIQSEFFDKIVYTTDMSFSEEPFIKHCSAIGGEFNSCGSTCESDAEICISVCAYTCNLDFSINESELKVD